ncbi:MAG: hypothetical protein WA306_09395 [Candidatus Acidiferrales bacterium]
MGKIKSEIDSTVESAPLSISPRLFRVIDTTKYLNCTIGFADALVRDRVLPVVILGKRHLIDKQDLDDYIDKLKSEGPAPKIS